MNGANTDPPEKNAKRTSRDKPKRDIWTKCPTNIKQIIQDFIRDLARRERFQPALTMGYREWEDYVKVDERAPDKLKMACEQAIFVRETEEEKLRVYPSQGTMPVFIREEKERRDRGFGHESLQILKREITEIEERMTELRNKSMTTEFGMIPTRIGLKSITELLRTLEQQRKETRKELDDLRRHGVEECDHEQAFLSWEEYGLYPGQDTVIMIYCSNCSGLIQDIPRGAHWETVAQENTPRIIRYRHWK